MCVFVRGYHVCLRYNLHLWSVFGDTVFGFRHLYSNMSLLRVVWMDRFMSVKTTKGRRRGYGVYMVSQQCLVHTMTRSDDDGNTNAKYEIDTAVMSSIPAQLEWPHVKNRLSLISSIYITSTTSRFETAHSAFGRSKRLAGFFHGKAFTRFDSLQQESHVHVHSSGIVR